jgi:RNA ligase (TIGR02306 family)
MSEKEGSTYKVPLTTILEIAPHPNADRLEVATVYGFQVVVKKDAYKVGDPVVYIPIDSILPEWLENKLFPLVKDPVSGAMVKPPFALNNSRIRQIRIRKLASQGMLVRTEDVANKVNFKKAKLEDDLANALGVTKYEPPVSGPSSTQGKDKQRNKAYEHPLFHKYNGLDNIKWFPSLFKEGEDVIIQEKLHGTNARASLLPYRTDTLWRKIVKLLGLAPKEEQCYGSNNVQKAVGRNNQHFYSEDVWGSTFKALDVFSRLQLGETVYGEIVGPGIQANYDYGLKEHKFVLFDVKVLDPVTGKQTWLPPLEVERFAKERGFDLVPILYRGPFNKDQAYTLTRGPSVYCPKQKVREGIVIKAVENYSVEGNKKALKWISEDYLDDKSNTDNH